MNKKTIKVTWEDIWDGDHVANSCPVALALKRATGETWIVTDHGFWPNRVITGNKIWSSTDVDLFVKDFDFQKYDGKKVKPFSFIVDLDAY